MSLHDKFISADRLDAAVAALPRPLVFTNGVFDILHPGHVTYLEQARALGKSLVIGLNSDASVRCLGKGGDRPIVNEMNRAIILAALESVDIVTLFVDPIPLSLIKRIKPDIYTKGGDYKIGHLAEAKLVQSWGGRAVALPFLNGFSTTSLLSRVRAV